ncbi:type II toxin-antitoxin system RelE/ParE family toxin [Chelatococcus sp. XZ-Ab1]|uniref:type II toxin-antitoxin system RelE family toxin n=1 Tax=Chelatococcus sp. XZ-Ab1 TaxID=3034027 RepID=UPI0023E40630|nr:type II toxin-antitoxin system RelE/ParE family toxin [Chelatococcus sp. XZ-Ab1]
MKTVTYTLAARRSLRKLPGDVRQQVEAKLARYAETGAGDIKALSGQPGARLRVGDYRVIIIETVAAVEVHAIGHRREIYR